MLRKAARNAGDGASGASSSTQLSSETPLLASAIDHQAAVDRMHALAPIAQQLISDPALMEAHRGIAQRLNPEMVELMQPFKLHQMLEALKDPTHAQVSLDR
jgi:hypothetical protein